MYAHPSIFSVMGVEEAGSVAGNGYRSTICSGNVVLILNLICCGKMSHSILNRAFASTSNLCNDNTLTMNSLSCLIGDFTRYSLRLICGDRKMDYAVVTLFSSKLYWMSSHIPLWEATSLLLSVLSLSLLMLVALERYLCLLEQIFCFFFFSKFSGHFFLLE